ncbi:zinc ion binding [Raphanus sativus]|uniref:E4 SUMO-protein ligase PIAL1-like n=1 Tax=Raphanus sativus TaxID=3726 RepID=A0A9W3C9B3_RAPSA|nr:E4 SUMO-protein ligase PIAL1-like [Raphanus sativus]KAJ4879027.1 zinc ion binding [Raphanus sativus]
MVIPTSYTEVESNKEFHAYCFSLANRIDACIGNDEVPVDAQDLAKALNQVFRRRCDDETKAVIMVLMISVKTACGLGWFPERESQELLVLVDSMWKGFSGPENVASGLNSPFSLIPQVMERFYPFTKLGKILVSSESEAESNIMLKDFHISKKMLQHSPKQKVGLFVIRTEDISKSSCIIHPQEVSFLLNGKGVDKRYGLSMDSGPQCPTNVTSLLNAGSNLLQAIGCFGGSYFIIIALFDTVALPANPLLKNYIHSGVIESNSDGDIIEGPSRISLSCPISRTRFQLPVKGHTCKHLQCFDFWNYVKINTRIPSWRCPHCNQSVCYTDIRVDQNMIKILKEVGGNVTDVVISADGSWRVVTENGENVGGVRETTHENMDPTSFQNLGPTVLDLTRDEDEMETSGGTQVSEQKPCVSEIRGLSSLSTDALPELPQTLNIVDGQQHVINSTQVGNTRDSAGRDAIRTNPYPQDRRLATNTPSFHISMPGAQSSQFQGSHVTPLRNCLGRTTDLMERWSHIYGNSTTQTPVTPMPPPLNHQYAIQNQRLPTRSMSTVQERSIPSSITHPQTLGVNNYGGTSVQRHMQTPVQRRNLVGAASSRESMNLTPANTGQIRMRGSLMPGSTGYDHMTIRPTQPVQTQAQTLPQATAYNYMPVQGQAQTLPQPQPTAYYNNIDDEIQAFLAQQTEAGLGSVPVAEGVGTLGSFWSMPPETW